MSNVSPNQTSSVSAPSVWQTRFLAIAVGLFLVAEAGTTQLRFEFVPVGDPSDQPADVLDISVIITD